MDPVLNGLAMITLQRHYHYGVTIANCVHLLLVKLTKRLTVLPI